MIKIDLHTHSIQSADGGITAKQYGYFLDNELLDVIAVTDHNGVEFAQQLQQIYGAEKIIVGQEIMTQAGEIIGLYLTKTIPAGLTLTQAVAQIKQQGGIVYVPHPFETVRSGLSVAAIEIIAGDVAIIEGYNGRAVFQNRGRQARAWAAAHIVPVAAGSDAHGRFGWGYTYSVIDALPTKDTLAELLTNAAYSTKKVGLGVLYPKLNRLRKRVRHAA